MATPTEIQAQLDPQGTGKLITIQTKFTVATTDTWYCIAGIGTGLIAGRNRWVTSTNSDTAAQQATSITNAMIA
jgi:hypothetical protein